MYRTTVLVLVFIAALASAEELFPKPDWKDAPNPLASPDAVQGGELSVFGGQTPKSFNYYLDHNTFSDEVFSAMYETLLGMHPITAEYQPGLAKRWSISDDKKIFTFWIDERARWSDGSPVTAEDVRWTYEAIMNPKHMTGPHKIPMERFNPPEVVSKLVVKFTAKEVHWQNLGAAGGFAILPKHAFENNDFNKINFTFPVVSGPYRLGDIEENVYAKLKRRDDWWGRQIEGNRNTGNFDTITFFFFAERENAFEAFKKGQIDLFPIYTSRLWVKETRGERFEKNWIVKQKVRNYQPVGFQGFAMNMRQPPFDDIRTRMAMSHLLGRERMNRTLMYSQYFMLRSYYEDLYSSKNPCPNPYYAFDKDKARKLLNEAGWIANPKTGLLEKNGQPFRFRFLTRSASSDKFLAIFGEDLKDVGIEMKLDKKDWASWSKDMDEFNFQMTWAAWSAGIFKDPESMWSSKEATRKSGNNITGFKNAAVDELIEKQKSIFDVGARHELCKDVDALVAAQCPYALLWYINYVRLLYWNKFGTPATVLSKYGDERSAYWYWWYDEDAVADLGDSMENGDYLPEVPTEVIFDEVFKK